MAVKSEPPRPSVVVWPILSCPWKPATITTLPASSCWRMSPPSISVMRALVWTLSVRMPACAPVRDTAGTPAACRAIAVSAIVSCSPMASSMSISRESGCAWSALASAISLFVTPLRAETTTTSWCPCRCHSLIRCATLRMRSRSPTEVPPYFCTIRAMF